MTSDDQPIRSRSHALLKHVRAVARGKVREETLLEGERLVRDALTASFPLGDILVREDDGAALARLTEFAPGLAMRRISRSAMEGIGTAKTTPSVVATMPRPRPRDAGALDGFLGEAGPRLLLLGVVGVADPGNLGALSRSAEAAGAGAILVAGESGARPFGARALRGSMGSLLRLPVFEIPAVASATRILASHGLQQCCARTRGGADLAAFPFQPRTAIWVSSETGDEPPELADSEGVTIPMAGGVESLNAGVAGALLLFEAARRWSE